MSLRVDTTSLISGSLVCGNRGLGVLGYEVPSGGDNGAGYLYNDLSLPADNDKEVRGLIIAPPSAGTLFAYENSSFEFAAPDGSYEFTYRLFVDGVDLGTATASISIGSVGVTIECTLGNSTATGYTAHISQAQTLLCNLAIAVADGYTANVSQSTNIQCVIGSSDAIGYDAVVVAPSPTVISCAAGTASAIGYQCSISAVSDGYFQIDPGYVVMSIEYSYAKINIDPEYWN